MADKTILVKKQNVDKKAIQKKETKKETKQEPKQQTSVAMTQIFGEAVWILLKSKTHKHSFFIADLDWMLIPAFMNKTFRIFKDKEKLVGLAIWANVSDEVDKRLEAGIGKLGFNDWKSGEHLWVIDLIALNGGESNMLENLRVSVFKDKIFKYQNINKEGKRNIITYDSKANKVISNK